MSIIIKERKKRRLRTGQTTSMRDMEEGGKYKNSQASFARDTGQIWNQAPKAIKEAKTLSAAKKEIKKYCITLPI